ncbi:MAG: MBL fold metallo-hydrolase, partial [Bradyrhizobium sp.]
GWAHFRQSAADLRTTFDALGLGKRLKLLEPGVPTMIEPLAV